MANLGQQIVAGVKANLAWAKEAAGNFAGAIKENIQTKGMQSDLRGKKIINQAQGEYTKKYGSPMSPSTLKGEMEWGILSSKAKDYLAMKDNATKAIK